MGGAFFGLIAGGFLGYHFAKERYSDSNAHSRCGNKSGGFAPWSRRYQDPQAVPVESNSVGSVPYWHAARDADANVKAPAVTLDPNELALFQDWKRQISQAGAQAHGQDPARQSFFGLQQPPTPAMDHFRSGAVESADKALDAILTQVQAMKEKLAVHKTAVERFTPSSPRTESGDFKVV